MKIGLPWRMHKQISWSWSLFYRFWYDCRFFPLPSTNSPVNFWTLKSNTEKNKSKLKFIFSCADQIYGINSDGPCTFLSRPLFLWISFNRIGSRPFFFLLRNAFDDAFDGGYLQLSCIKNVLWIFHLCLFLVLLFLKSQCLHLRCRHNVEECIFFLVRSWPFLKGFD